MCSFFVKRIVALFSTWSMFFLQCLQVEMGKACRQS